MYNSTQHIYTLLGKQGKEIIFFSREKTEDNMHRPQPSLPRYLCSKCISLTMQWVLHLYLFP